MIKPKSFRNFLFSFCALFIIGSGEAQVNLGFESTMPGACTSAYAITGWTLQSAGNNLLNGACGSGTYNTWSSTVNEVSVVSTPVFNHPYIGLIPPSPLGGTRILQLNDHNGTSNVSCASTTFSVNNTNNVFRYAYCGSWDGSTACCSMPFAKILILDCTGIPITCLSPTLTPSGPLCSSGVPGYSMTGNVNWSNWIQRSVDLSAFEGSCVTVKVIAGDGDIGAFHGQLFFDAEVTSQKTAVSYCGNSSQAVLNAPEGYSNIQWHPPVGYLPINQATVTPLNLYGVSGTFTYSLTGITAAGCQISKTYTVAPTTISVGLSLTKPTCLTGSSGCATVQGTGSSLGYNYTWYNTTNSVIGTNSTIANLSQGTYTCIINSSIGMCGAASTVINIGTQSTSLTIVPKAFCSSTAYLHAPAGSSYQWYSGFSPLTGSLGVTPSLSIANAPNNSSYTVVYTTSQGCKDSVLYKLITTSPQPVYITKSTVCYGSNNITATISLGLNQSPGANSVTVSSSGTTAPYNYSVSQSQSLTFPISGLSAGGSYTITGFDGSCPFTSSLVLTPANQNFTISPSSSATICSGATQWLTPILVGPPITGYNFLWQPPLFTVGGSNNSFLVLTNTLGAGSQSLVTYTVTMKNNNGVCALSKTVNALFHSPATPTVQAIPIRCRNAPTFTIPVNPAGGIFWGTNFVGGGGIVYLPNTPAGTHTFVYSTYLSTCAASTTGSFTILEIPVTSVSGATTMCIGKTTTLSASGSDSYAWSTGHTGPLFYFSPVKTTNVYVTGTSTNGCSSTTNILIVPVPIPTVQVTGNTLVCQGEKTNLIASGASNYLWSVGSAGAILSFKPNYNNTYTVTGYNSSACFRSATVAIVVKDSPTLSVSGRTQTCAGYNVGLTVNGAMSYTWNNTITSKNFTSVPTSNITYTVSGTGPNGCVTNSIVPVTILPSPSLTVTGNTLLPCGGQSTTLTASGADSYLWLHDSSIVSTRIFQTPATTSYTVVGTFTNECTTKKVITVSVSICSETEEFEMNARVSVFPNPANNKLFMYSPEKIRVELFDGQGKLIQQQRIDELNSHLDFSLITPGIYNLRVYNLNDEVILKKKIIKVE